MVIADAIWQLLQQHQIYVDTKFKFLTVVVAAAAY